MALSFFGLGKKRTPTDHEPSNKVATRSDDEYVVIERIERPASDIMYPIIGPGGTAVSLPYHVQPEIGVPAIPDHGDTHSSNPLDEVPFKLSSLLTGGSCDWSRSDAAHFKSVMSRAVHNNETLYKYDFSHEESIMRESNQGSADVG